MLNLILVFTLLGTFHARSQGQLGGSGGEMSPEVKVRVSKEHANEFKELDRLTNKLIEYSDSRFKHCNRVDIKIKNLSDLYAQLAGQELKLLAGKHYADPKSLHCKGTDKAQKKETYSCLMDKGPRKVIRRMLKNEAFFSYLRVRADLSEQETNEAIRFFSGLI